MGKIKKIFVILAAVCLSTLLAAGSAMATPAWKNHPQGKGQDKAEKARMKVHFVDISGHWAEQNIVLINAENVIKGYEDKTFQPNKPVNKEEAITMIVRMTGGDFSDSGQYGGKQRDLSKASWWARSFLDRAVEKGILSEVELNSIAFNKPAQRYEVTVWLVRALGLEDKAIKEAGSGLDFRDEEAIPAWARGYVKVATDEGIIAGFPGHVFRPGAPVTRAEMATMLVRAREFFQISSPRQGFSFVRGVISEADGGGSPSITIKKTGFPSMVGTGQLTVEMADDALVYLDGKAADLEDLEKGDGVAILLNGDRKAIVVIARSTGDRNEDEDDDEDDNDSEKVDGIVESISSSSITVKVGGQLKVYALDNDVEVKVDGDEAELDDVKKGYEVELTLEDGEVTEIEAESGKVEISGVMESLGSSSITVKVNGTLKVYTLSGDVDVTLDGKDADTDDLEKGYQVELTVENDKVTSIEALSGTISGQLESVGESSITVKVDGEFKVYGLSNVVVIVNGSEKNLNDLAKGMDVKLTLENYKVVKIVVD
ncbi:MAG: S-layer homology domain-containing protein [Bacillota bacterium]